MWNLERCIFNIEVMNEPSCAMIDWQKREPLTLDHTKCSKEH